jgi:hypothetical protein
MAVIEANGIANALASSVAKSRMAMSADGISNPVSSSSAWLINPVKISSVVAYSLTKIRITFDRPMKKNSALTNIYNYEITPAPSAAPISYSVITPESIASPRYVDVVLDTEMTNNGTYNLEIATVDGPIDNNGNPLTADTNTDIFFGLGELPEILSVKAVSQNRVDVIFTESMEDNLEIRDKTNYTFDKGLLVLDVLDLVSDTIQLVTSDQTPGELYTLTVVPA